ncbi:hypothetical protein J6590_041898 [Homalodisca vitripennis]|nr:hypothetical protein J6590_041898 [Homalodisca vitripennis]
MLWFGQFSTAMKPISHACDNGVYVFSTAVWPNRLKTGVRILGDILGLYKILYDPSDILGDKPRYWRWGCKARQKHGDWGECKVAAALTVYRLHNSCPATQYGITKQHGRRKVGVFTSSSFDKRLALKFNILYCTLSDTPHGE